MKYNDKQFDVSPFVGSLAKLFNCDWYRKTGAVTDKYDEKASYLLELGKELERQVIWSCKINWPYGWTVNKHDTYGNTIDPIVPF